MSTGTESFKNLEDRIIMNSLSWVLYFADVLPNLAGLLVGCSIVLGTTTLFLWGAYVITSGVDGGEADFNKSVKKPASVTTILFVISALTASVIPSKETFYLIAGSEVGETVVTSDEGKEIISDIHDVIKHQLSNLKGESK